MSELVPVILALTFLLTLAVLSWMGLRFLARETAHKGKWGINRTVVCCPGCGSRMPRFRIPTTIRQAVWGGWTCKHCECEMDKWGRKIDPHLESTLGCRFLNTQASVAAHHRLDALEWHAAMIPQFRHLKEMPKALVALTWMFAVCGLISIVLAILPTAGWTYQNWPVTYGEFWRSGGGILVVAFGVALVLLAVGFYKAQGWVRYAVPVGLATITIYDIISPDPTARFEWVASLFCGILAWWYFFWKRTVVDYFAGARGAEGGASPNGGQAE